jgi:microcompartment protein CcmK/EutM
VPWQLKRIDAAALFFGSIESTQRHSSLDQSNRRSGTLLWIKRIDAAALFFGSIESTQRHPCLDRAHLMLLLEIEHAREPVLGHFSQSSKLTRKAARSSEQAP